MTSAPTRPGVKRGTIPVFATATAVTVSNIYFAQPLLDEIAHSFHTSASTAGVVATAGQLGYALGIVTVVPLADGARLRRLSTVLLVITTTGLLAGAAAPSVALLGLAALVLSAGTVLPQVIMPTVVSMAAEGNAGRVLAAVGTGLTLGALLSRTVAGLVVEATGTWRAGFVVAAVATGALLLVLPQYMPEPPPTAARGKESYARLLGSLPGLITQYASLRVSAALGATVFAAFSAFWSSLAFHLTAPPIGLGPAVIGLFGLFSVPGALAARYSGRLADRWGPLRVNVMALAAGALAFVLFAVAGRSLVLLAIGCNLLGFGTTSSQIANQARVFAAQPAIRARLNTVYIFSVFAGGAAGSAVAAASFSAAGWSGVVMTGLGFLLLAAVALTWHKVRTVHGPAGRPPAGESLPGSRVLRGRARKPGPPGARPGRDVNPVGAGSVVLDEGCPPSSRGDGGGGGPS
ncbi:MULTISPECIES: MFS transporter [Streptomyces]|uniref:MFS transporter n=1 Tax=Streptomyces TaxID=1883 RepID=UPI0009A0DC32|nr:MULTISPECIES: MFS transporter [Streptomyces]MZD59235.1 MFS transporter [Streptomyces sp. SID5606]GGS05902.1 MFS transporter [Streptomyces parvulus]